VIEFDPYTADALRNPYDNYARLREAGRVLWSPKLNTWLVPRHDDALEFFGLREDPSLAARAVEEFLRFDSPAQMISSTALEDFTWHGAHIESGDSVLALVGAANGDGEMFVDPDALDVDRQPNPHLAFGAGIHFCPGAQLTRLRA